MSSLNSCRRKNEHYGGGGSAASTSFEDAPLSYLWQSEEKWHVVASAEPSQRQKIDSTLEGNDLFPPLNLRRCARKKTRPHVSEEEKGHSGTSPVKPVLRRPRKKPLLKLPEGKVMESFAVVKRSENPYADFRSSMAEMIIENEMYEEEDLEQLLHCFLLLNSRPHHPAIVRAFSDVWAALFPSN